MLGDGQGTYWTQDIGDRSDRKYEKKKLTPEKIC